MKTTGARNPAIFEIVPLGDDTAEILLRENIEIQNGEYVFDEYILTVPVREGLEESIEANLSGWLDTARENEYRAVCGRIRKKRDELLAETDWTQCADAPLSRESIALYRAYRQELRDITEQEGFPYSVVYPALPGKEKADPDPIDEAFDILMGDDM